jgi:hypothetical protein
MSAEIAPDKSAYPSSLGEWAIGAAALHGLSQSMLMGEVDPRNYDTVYAIARRGDEVAMELIGINEGDGR